MEETLEELYKLKKLSKEDFLHVPKNYLSTQRALEICINICIDVASHIISVDAKKKPETYRQIFDILAEIKVIPSNFKEIMKKMVGFRNILTHIYMEIDNIMIYQIIQENLSDFKKFKQFIYKKYKKNLV